MVSALHIGIDALFRLGEGGAQTHLTRLLNAWSGTSDRISVYTTPDGARRLRSAAGDNVRFEVFDLPGRHFVARLVWEQIVFPQVLARADLDMLLCPGNLIPLRSPVPTAVMIRNVAPFCASITPHSSGLYPYWRFQAVGQLMRRSIQRAECSIFVSETARDLLAAHCRVNPARSVVIRHGTERYVPAAHPPLYDFPYVVYVSAIWPYKNMREVIDGYAELLRAEPTCDWRLVLVGRAADPRYASELRAQAARLGLADRVIFTGNLPLDQVHALLDGAAAAVFASTCESFALPLLEAMQAGIPLACADTPIAREIVGTAAAWFDPYQPASIGAALAQLWRDPALRHELGEQGLARAATFEDWTSVAAQTRAALARIAKMPRA